MTWLLISGLRIHFNFPCTQTQELVTDVFLGINVQFSFIFTPRLPPFTFYEALENRKRRGKDYPELHSSIMCCNYKAREENTRLSYCPSHQNETKWDVDLPWQPLSGWSVRVTIFRLKHPALVSRQREKDDDQPCTDRRYTKEIKKSLTLPQNSAQCARFLPKKTR